MLLRILVVFLLIYLGLSLLWRLLGPWLVRSLAHNIARRMQQAEAQERARRTAATTPPPGSRSRNQRNLADLAEEVDFEEVRK